MMIVRSEGTVGPQLRVPELVAIFMWTEWAQALDTYNELDKSGEIYVVLSVPFTGTIFNNFANAGSCTSRGQNGTKK